MPDKFAPDVRSKIMQSIRGKNTTLELRVRSFLHKEGFRFRIHKKELAGKPDIVLPKWRTVIFVHGCFWHQHQDTNCPYSKKPKSNKDYWLPKFERTVQRDKRHTAELEALGWNVITIWECQVSDENLIRLIDRIKSGAA